MVAAEQESHPQEAESAMDEPIGAPDMAFDGNLPDVEEDGDPVEGEPTASERAYDHPDWLTAFAGEKAQAAPKKPAAKAPKQFPRGGNALTVSTPDTDKTKEAPILNAIRDSNKKFEPRYLKKLQAALGATETGSFNTETLRKLREHYASDKSVKVTASTILQGNILTKLVAGTPFKDTGSGYGTGTRGGLGTIAKEDKKADELAKAMGYASYKDLHSNFTKIKLLGRTLGLGLPHLADRVALADQWLRDRHGANFKDADAIAEHLGWTKTSRHQAAYGDSEDSIGQPTSGTQGVHFHAVGLAIDIDLTHNPWVFHGDDNKENGSNDRMARHIRYAAQIYGGEELNAATMEQWGKEMSSEELYARVSQVSKSFESYLTLADTGSDKQIEDAFTKAGYSEADAKSLVPDVRAFGKKNYIPDGKKTAQKRTWDYMNREDAKSLTNHSLDMIIALRDVAGLSWGGTDMSGIHNGDFMHFDCRNQEIGSTVTGFAKNNRKVSDTENAKLVAAEKLAAEKQKSEQQKP